MSNRLRVINWKRAKAMRSEGTSLSIIIVTARAYQTLISDRHRLCIFHVFISTDLYNKPVLDTIIHFWGEESKALDIHTDSQWQN